MGHFPWFRNSICRHPMCIINKCVLCTVYLSLSLYGKVNDLEPIVSYFSL